MQKKANNYSQMADEELGEAFEVLKEKIESRTIYVQADVGPVVEL